MLVMTASVNEKTATDTKFAKLVTASLSKFANWNWGDVCAEDAEMNTKDAQALSNGEYGRIIASYSNDETKIWIVKDLQATVIMFPEEY